MPGRGGGAATPTGRAAGITLKYAPRRAIGPASS